MASQVLERQEHVHTGPSAPVSDLGQSSPLPSHAVEKEEPANGTRLAKLNLMERYWTWKAGIRVAICILNIIAIGCLGWLMAASGDLESLLNYGLGFIGMNAGAITGFGVSFLWCLVAIVIPLSIKRTRPLHPGIAVGIDLVMWLGFMVLGLFMVAGVYEAIMLGSGGYIQDPSYGYSNGYSGSYYLAPNDTWIYNITYTRDSNTARYNRTTGVYDYPPLNTTGIIRSCTPYFKTCQDQDQFVNSIWRQRSRRIATTIMVDAAAWLNMLLHFTVFVWACVDTHRKRALLKKGAEQVIAEKIVADLEKRGLISVIDGIVHPVRTGQPEVVPAEGDGLPGLAR